eukprot:Gb_34918 [translate_table: standard]
MALGCASAQQLCSIWGVPCNTYKLCPYRSAHNFCTPKALMVGSLSGLKLRPGLQRSILVKPSHTLPGCWAVGGTATESSLAYASVEDTPLTLYEILGISQGVSDGEVKDAYRSLAKKYHPDHAPLGKMEEYQKKFLEVHKAYSILKDSRRRALYDFEIKNSLCYQRNWRFEPKTGLWRGCNWETDQCWTC